MEIFDDKPNRCKGHLTTVSDWKSAHTLPDDSEETVLVPCPCMKFVCPHEIEKAVKSKDEARLDYVKKHCCPDPDNTKSSPFYENCEEEMNKWARRADGRFGSEASCNKTIAA